MGRLKGDPAAVVGTRDDLVVVADTVVDPAADVGLGVASFHDADAYVHASRVK